MEQCNSLLSAHVILSKILRPFKPQDPLEEGHSVTQGEQTACSPVPGWGQHSELFWGRWETSGVHPSLACSGLPVD